MREKRPQKAEKNSLNQAPNYEIEQIQHQNGRTYYFLPVLHTHKTVVEVK